MWDASEEPPGTMEGGPPEPMIHAREKCEQNKNQLESFKELMLKNKQSLKKKEEEVQEYARRLSKIKSRPKLSRRNKEGASTETTNLPKPEAILADAPEESIDDISQAKTPKAKSNLLQKKLAENRKAFEQRSKEITETKRAVEEKVEAIRQQLEEKEVAIMGLQKNQIPVTPVRPIVVTSDIMSPIQIGQLEEKDSKIAELSSKILELEATVLDLQENLKEKDSVIESKTKAVTLMSADLSKKGKTTLDTLEDTKDEMRTMQEHFVLLETSLKNKNENLLQQLHDRDSKISELEDTVKRFEQQLNEQKLVESASADFSRSTMDALVETKDAMKSMQENFVLIESSLKAKNDNLLQQMQDYELKLAEANQRVFQLESGVGIVKSPSVDDLQYKLDKLEQSNKQLQDEKYELQKSIAEMQDKIVNRSLHGNGALLEKDNRIAELENLIEELKQSNTLLEEESKAELQKQVAELTVKNEEYSNKVTDLEKMVHILEAEKNDMAAKIPDEYTATKEDDRVVKLTKELEELNKTMIKMKVQHRSKVKNLQKQLENFKMVSDTNAELVRLGNQVALLEEEKGNLLLSLVDFDELKASAGDWQERIADLETKVSAQTKEIQMNIEAIATLENQKLDLMQELHSAKQEISALEAENAESENLRVTAEMKVVDLEEQLELLHKSQKESKAEESAPKSHSTEKIISESGSTESFEAIQETDKTDLLRKIEDLTQRNNELTLKLTKLEEKSNSHAGSTESFETINDVDKQDLLKKIDQLTQENTDLTMKLNRFEEKGSSDTGSTESFERIPEQTESMTKIELLTQENSELVIKLTKLEEQLEHLESNRLDTSKSDADVRLEIEALRQENNDHILQLENLRAQVTEFTEENSNLQKRIEVLTAENNDLVIRHTKLEERILQSGNETADTHKRSVRETDAVDQIQVLIEEKSILEKELKELRNNLEQSSVLTKVSELEESNQNLLDSLKELTREKEELQIKINDLSNDFAQERSELISKLETVNHEKEDIAQQRQELQEKINMLSSKSNTELLETQADQSNIDETDSMLVTSLEREIENYKKLIVEQTDLIEEMKMKLESKEKELEEKTKLIIEHEDSERKAESLEQELKDMLNTMEEWKYKCNEMEEKMKILEAGKASIEDGLRTLQTENELLLEEKKEKEAMNNLLKQQLEENIASLESRLQEEVATVIARDNEISLLKDTIQSKDQELSAKYSQLQNEMIAIDNLQDELSTYKALLQERDSALMTVSDEAAKLSDIVRSKEEDMHFLKKDLTESHDKLQKEYHELVEVLTNKDLHLHQIQSRLDENANEKSNLLVKVEDLSQQNEDLQNHLTQMEQEVSELKTLKEHLEHQIVELENKKTVAENQVSELEAHLDKNSKFVENLQDEISSSYKQMEGLKEKYVEDTQKLNEKLEVLMQELNTRTQENDVLKNEIEEKQRLLGRNVTEEVKIALEARVTELEKELADANEKIQMQLEKMKKIAATLKKKTALCQELEGRVADLEEKWTTEKTEKEEKVKKIEEAENVIREAEKKIIDLEEKLMQARKEVAESLLNTENVATELANSKEKMSSLIQQITEMEEEIMKLRAENDSCTAQLETERREKEKIVSEFESYKQTVAHENEHTQMELEEFKEKARELSVRMQVMEAEYVEQLALIKNLKAENGLLLSKQTQINEKLENAEKKSEECKLIIEQLQSETTTREATTTGAATQTEEETAEDDTRTSAVQHFDHCEQCQTLVQALEAKLQEREAEIENLDNELANSIGNFVQMRESLRFNDLMNQTSMRNRSLEDPYNELLFQYNTLTTNHEEINVKLNDVLKENKELKEKIESLESINATMSERIVGMEQELAQDREQMENVQSDSSVNVDLVKKCELRETELLNMQKEIETIRQRAEKLEEQLNSQTSQFSSEKEQLMEKEKLLVGMKESLEQEIESLKNEKMVCEKRMDDLEKELEMHKQQSIVCKEESMVLNEAPVADRASNVQDDAPQLFDASKIFGTAFGSDSSVSNDKEVARLEKLLSEKEVQCSNLTAEIDHLQKLMTEERSRVSQDYITCSQKLKMTLEYLDTARADVEHLKHDLAEKDKQIESLNLELSSIQSHALVHLQQQNDTDKPDSLMLSQDNHMDELMAELNSTKEMLGELTVERDRQNQAIESYKLQIANFEAELRNSTDTDLIQDLEQRILVTLKEKDLLQLQVNDLSRALEEVKETAERQRNLHIDIDNAMRERDEAKELVANLTQALEESHKRLAEIEVQKRVVREAVEKETLLEEPEVSKDSYQQQQASKSSTDNVEPAVHLDVGSAWDAGSTEKLNVDEETWGWNAEDVQGTDDQQISAKLIPSTEMQLRVKIDDLQDQIKDLEAEKEKIVEGNKAAQVRSGKMVKKLKEYKVQIENLQQQLKMQKSASDFYELDSAIEEELKSQISKLEKNLNELKEEHKNTVAEKESIMKRLDVVVSANERYMEMKERQDMDMEVLRIQNKELTQKIQALDARLQENVTSGEKSEPPSSEGQEQRPSENVESSVHQPRKRSIDDQTDFEGLSKKYKDEIDDLKDEMEALAAENEQLQHFLEEQKTKLSSLEMKRNEEESEYMQVIDELNRKVSELQGILNKSKEEYDLLRKQYEQSLMDANDQVSVMRQNTDLLKAEAFEKNSKLETEITNLRQQTEVSELKISQLEKNLQDALQEKISLEEKVVALTDTEEKLSSVNMSLTEVTDLLNVRIQEVADLKQELQRQYIDREQVESKLQNDIDAVSQELNAKKQELEDLRQSFSDKERELIQQQESVETVSAIVSQATQELAQKHAIEVEGKDMEIRELMKKISTLEATIDGYSLEIQNNVATFTSLQQELEFLKQNLAEKDLILESVQSTLNTTKEEVVIKQTKLTACEEELNALTLEKQKYLGEINDLQTRLSESEAASSNLHEYTVRMENLQRELEVTKTALSENELVLQQYVQQSEEYQAQLEICKSEINQLRTGLQEIDILRSELREKTDQISYLNSELETTQKALEETRKTLSEKISSLESTKQLLNEKQLELEKFSTTSSAQQQSEVVNIIDGLPVFHMSDNNTQDLQNTIDALKEQLEKKDEEIEHLKYILSENTYPSIIQEMQDQINVIYNQKNDLETALSIATQTLAEKEKQLIDMEQHIQVQSQEVVSKEEMNLLSRERRSTHDQEEIVRLQNEVHAKEQEINDLKYIIAEKDSQLSLQASMESPSDDFELREMVQRLTAEVYGKEQEIKHLKSTITELQKEISHLQEFERISKESKDTIQKLTLEKEHVRLEGEEILEKKLREKEAEIDEIKQRLAIENQKILDELHLRDKDIENLRKQLEQSSAVEHETTDKLHQKEVELMQVHTDLAEKERRLAELSITKDAELHNLKVQIHEKDVRIEELLALSEEEEKQLVELRNSLDARETEVNTLKRLLEDKVKEYELIQHTLKKDIPMMDAPASSPVEGTTSGESKQSTSQELDLALYMLHQRDVRCEELTHELMQLLEERDTLQLRLSNAIRVNEELRRMGSSDSSSKKEASSPESEEPLVEHPSPSKSEGPVEIAKEAIDSPIGEDKEALALNTGRSEPIERSSELAVGQKHAQGRTHVMNE